MTGHEYSDIMLYLFIVFYVGERKKKKPTGDRCKFLYMQMYRYMYVLNKKKIKT